MTTAKSADGAELRQRNTKVTAAASNGSTEKKSPAKKKTAPASSSPLNVGLLDIFRAIAGIALVSTIASYAVTRGESFTWGVLEKKPWWLDLKQIQQAFKSPLLLTNDQLSAYDGSDPGKPILLALNRTIYDVSSSAQVYGPGGPYSSLAAKDASRSYITTCFDPVDDLVPYLGGVEEIYVPLWLSKKPMLRDADGMIKGEIVDGKDAEDIIDEIHKKIGRKHIKRLRNEAYDKAKERVKEQVKTWEGMFEKKGYPIVGKVIGVDEDDPTKWRHLGFCEAAKKLRPGMGETLTEAFTSVGKGDKLNLNMGRQMGQMAKKMNKKTKKKYGKKKKTDDDEPEDNSAKEGETEFDHSSNEKADATLEDMLKGGKWFEKNKGKGMSEEEIMKYGPMGGDTEGAKKARKIFEKERKRHNIPDAIPDEAIENKAEEKMEESEEGVTS